MVLLEFQIKDPALGPNRPGWANGPNTSIKETDKVEGDKGDLICRITLGRTDEEVQ
jgi:hypothetical protein